MYLSTLLINVGDNPDRPRPGRLWLRNVYRVHQRLCMAFPSRARVAADPEFLQPYRPAEFGGAHVHVARATSAGFLYRIDPRPPGRAVILVQSMSAEPPDWTYAFRNAQHLLATNPATRQWTPSFTNGQRLRFRLRANAVRRIAASSPEKDGPRVPVAATDDALRSWLSVRGKRAGFELDELFSIVPGYVYMNKFGNRGEGLKLRSVLYEGALTVIDAAAFCEAICRGIGPAKAFGFGLLSIAPVR